MTAQMENRKDMLFNLLLGEKQVICWLKRSLKVLASFCCLYVCFEKIQEYKYTFVEEDYRNKTN